MGILPTLKYDEESASVVKDKTNKKGDNKVRPSSVQQFEKSPALKLNRVEHASSLSIL